MCRETKGHVTLLSFVALAALLLTWPMSVLGAGELQIHYINVGQGGSTLIIGPNGTAILYDFGKNTGDRYIIPYLLKLPEFRSRRTIEYAFISHADTDHIMGYKDIIDQGFQITLANIEPGTSKRGGKFEQRALAPARGTVAGAFQPAKVGLIIPLGLHARAIIVAANGYVIGEPPADDRRPRRVDENDRSIALFVEFNDFQYLIDGDLGSGSEPCTNHETTQRSVQPRVASALLAQGLISPDQGVDVLHIAHHGSESSTSAAYYNLMKPEVGVISVGPNQGTYKHPRKSVVENVLTCVTRDSVFSPSACDDSRARARPTCVNAQPLRGLFQTDNGNPDGCKTDDAHCVSTLGWVVGNFVIRTDGKTLYTIKSDGQLTKRDTRPNVMSPNTWSYPLDEISAP